MTYHANNKSFYILGIRESAATDREELYFQEFIETKHLLIVSIHEGFSLSRSSSSDFNETSPMIIE